MEPYKTCRDLKASDFIFAVDSMHKNDVNEWLHIIRGSNVLVHGKSYVLDADTSDALCEFSVFTCHIGRCALEWGLDDAAQSELLAERQTKHIPNELKQALLVDALAGYLKKLEQQIGSKIEWLKTAATEKPAIVIPFVLKAPDSHTVLGRVYMGFASRADLQQIIHWGLSLKDHAPKRLQTVIAKTLSPLSCPMSFCIGHTHLALQDIHHIQRGDIISIEKWQSIGNAIGGYLYWGMIEKLHLFAIAKNTKITVHNAKELNMSESSSETLDAAIPLNRLDAMEVVLRFHVGDLSVSLGELKNVGHGHVFELSEPINRSAVRIMANGHALGHGHLVTVGDRLGVRVSEFAPQTSAP